MAGLMNSTAMTPPGAPMQPPGTQSEEGQATPEQQQQYDEIVGRAYLLIFDEKKGEVRDGVVKMLKAGDPKEAIAQATASVYSRVAQEARKSGIRIDPEVRDGAIEEVFEKLAEIATTVGNGGDLMKNDEAFTGAYYAAVDATRMMEQAAGGVDQQAEAERMRGMVGQFEQPRGLAPEGGQTPGGGA